MIALRDADRTAWAALAARALEPNPFFEPGFVTAAAERMATPDVALLVAREGERWLACVPVARAGRRWRVPAREAWTHDHAFLGTPLLDGERPEAAARALLRVAARDRRATVLVLPQARADGPVAAELRRAAARRGARVLEVDRQERAALDRRPEEDYLQTTLKPHRRRELQRLGRRLEAELGELEVADRAGDPAAVERFLALEASGWKGREATALAADAGHAAFFRELCARYAAAGRLQLLELRAGGRPVAMKCNLLAADGIFCFKIAFDEELAAFSPGVQLEVRMIGLFHGHTSAAWMDSCAHPRNGMINRLWGDRRAICTLVLPAGPAGAVATQLLHAARRTRARPTA